MNRLIVLLAALSITSITWAQTTPTEATTSTEATPTEAVIAEQTAIDITPEQAKDNVGKFVKVCGQIVDTAYLDSFSTRPTFLNFSLAHPDSPLTVVIQGEHRDKFTKDPEIFYQNKTICVTGTISLHNGKPQVIVTDESMIKLKSAE